MPVSRDFLARHAVEVAPELLGCVLEHETAAGLVAIELTEVEAYAGQTDPASHAYHGMTRRNAVMFGPPGHAYVYFTYGMHFCVNLVCSGEGNVSAVLLRAGAVIEGEDLARARRSHRRLGGARNQETSPQAPPDQAPPHRGPLAWRDLARGPGRLCQALDIDRSLDGADVCIASSPLRLRPGGTGPGAGTTDRSGSVLARGDEPKSPGETPGKPAGTPGKPGGTARKIVTGPRVGVALAAEVPWRFWFAGDPTVSLYRAHVPRRRGPAPRKLVTP